MVYTTRTPVSGSGFCNSSFAPRAPCAPAARSCYTRPSYGFGSSYCRPVTSTPVYGSGYYGNSLFGSSSSYCYPRYSSYSNYSCMPSYSYTHCHRPAQGTAAALAGMVAGLAVFAALA